MRVYVEVDEDDVLDEISVEKLRRELTRRGIKDIEIPSMTECNVTLSDCAFELRKIGKINLAWRLDEIRHDYFTEKKL